MSHADARIALHADDVSLLLDASGGELPAVVYWGERLDEVTDAEFLAMSDAIEIPPISNGPDVPVRMSMVPEARTGWTGRPGLSASRGGRDWSPRWRVSEVTFAGAPVTGLLNAAEGVAVFTASDDDAKLGLCVSVEMLPSGLVRARAEVTNRGDDYTVDEFYVVFPLPSRAREVLDFAGRWTKERTPQRQPLMVGTHWREGRHGRTGADAATILNVGTPGFNFRTGEIWGLHTAWSGNHVHYAERLYTGRQTLAGGELLLPGEVILSEGQSYATPWVYANYAQGLDAAARRFHRYLRSRPGHPDANRPVTLNVWEAVYFDHNLERLLDLADRAADLGVERFVLDDGWFGGRRNDFAGLGDWWVSQDVWPDGLHPLIKRVRELGMQFGLWFEPEMINLDSETARAHPEWIMQTGGRLPVESRHQQVINLGIPECYAYIRDHVMALLDEYPIDYIKWDHNRDLVDAGTMPTGRPGVHEQTLAFYRLVDELKAAHPGLEIESCSSGGARVDLEVLQRTERVWVSDCIDPVERQLMNRWTTQLIPPEMMGSHIASGRSHTTGRVHDLEFRAITSMFGHMGIEWDLTEASPENMAALKDAIDFHKQHRGLLLRGDVVRIDTIEPHLYMHGVVAPDKSEAIYSFCYTERTGESSYGPQPLPGLDPNRRYQVTPTMVGPWGFVFGAKWWHMTPEPTFHSPPDPTRQAKGEVFTGKFLEVGGLMTPFVPADYAFLYVVTAVD